MGRDYSKTYDDGGVDSVITTRRLINIVKAYAIWGDIDKAIMVCVNRFDEDTKMVFTQLYDKLVTPTMPLVDDEQSQDQTEF